MKKLVEKLKWMGKQLLPLEYVGEYRQGSGSVKQVMVWRMWLGRVSNLRVYDVTPAN